MMLLFAGEADLSLATDEVTAAVGEDEEEEEEMGEEKEEEPFK